jgi:peptidoglycan/LPS O-acetylase OafA/YrhL
VFFLGWLLNFLTVKVLIWINLASGNVNIWVSVMYLLFERPLFITGTTLQILPFLLRTPGFKPIANLMSSAMWYPLARLTYGAYLCHGILMLFRTYNTSQGVFANEFDAFLFFFAYVAFAFLFSFFATVLIETPCLRFVDSFIVRSKGSLASNLSASFKNLTTKDKDEAHGGAQDLLIDQDHGKDVGIIDSSPKAFRE